VTGNEDRDLNAATRQTPPALATQKNRMIWARL
jgi:hypothetical protein